MKAQTKAQNKVSGFNYTLTDKLEVGLVLHGDEVKGIINGGMSLKESYVKIINTLADKPEVWLINSNITVTANNSFRTTVDYNIRPRKLLLHKKQINKYMKLLKTPGTTLILYDVYNGDNGKMKGTLCLAKGKREYEKRNTIKERDIARDIRNV